MNAIDDAIRYLETLTAEEDEMGVLDDHEYERELGRAARAQFEEAKLWRQRALNAEEIVRDLRGRE